MKALTICVLLLPLFVVAQSPGGFNTHLKLWNKADAGVTTRGDTVTAWNDQSGINQFKVVGAPRLKAEKYNYNPAIVFDGHSRFIGNTNINAITHAIVVGRLIGALKNSPQAMIGVTNAEGGYFFSTKDSVPRLSCSDGKSRLDAAVSSSSIRLSILSEDLGKTPAKKDVIRRNGTPLPNISKMDPAPFKGIPTLGSRGKQNITNTSALVECIVYNASLSAVNLNKVESYLAVKYGITLSTNYVNAAGDTVYDISSYKNDIIGIARDDRSALMQKQSHTKDDSTRIYLATLKATNKDNQGVFKKNRSFVMAGNDAGNMSLTNSAEYPAGLGISRRLNREWKIANTNFEGKFSMDFKLKLTKATAAKLKVLIDDDGNFSNAKIYSPAIKYNNGVATVTGINNIMIPQGQTKHLTLAVMSPGELLPVVFAGFTAQQKDAVIVLNWTAASEQYNTGFVVERSTDGLHWFETGKVQLAGNALQLHHYSYTDNAPLSSLLYYRLRQTDASGLHHYSPVQVVRPQIKAATVQLYPNPAHGQVIIEGEWPGAQKVFVFDEYGRDCTHQVTTHSNANNALVVDINGLPQGMYILKVDNQSFKVLKE